MGAVSRREGYFWENYEQWKQNHQEFRISRDLLKVDWKSEKYRGMERGNSKMTPVMWKSLRNLLVSDGTRLQNRTLKALQWRRLVDKEGQLTDHGRVLALTQVSLRQQCRLLDLPLEECYADSLDHPEQVAVEKLAEQGIWAYFLGNTFGLFISYLTGDALTSTAKRLGRSVFSLDLTCHPEAFFWIKRDLASYLDGLDENHCQEVFAACAPFLESPFNDRTPLQLLRLFDDMYRALGIDMVRSILKMYFSNPLAYSFKGWPDLFVVGGQGAYFIEVKTIDKLHLNQLVTIPDLIHHTGVSVGVMRLRRPNDS